VPGDNLLQPRSAGINSGDGQRQDLNDADPGDTHTSIGGCVRADPNSGTESGGAGNRQRAVRDKSGGTDWKAFSEWSPGNCHECGAKGESGSFDEAATFNRKNAVGASFWKVGRIESESEHNFSWNKNSINSAGG
jgi:hypothetical protein